MTRLWPCKSDARERGSHIYIYISIYIYKYLYIYIYHICIPTYIHSYLHTYMATNRHTYTLRSLLTSLPKYIFAFMHTCMHACIHTYMVCCKHSDIYTVLPHPHHRPHHRRGGLGERVGGILGWLDGPNHVCIYDILYVDLWLLAISQLYHHDSWLCTYLILSSHH